MFLCLQRATAVLTGYIFSDVVVTNDGASACGITVSGAVTCWGVLAGGSTKVVTRQPSGPITHLAVGPKHVCGILVSTGMVECVVAAPALFSLTGAVSRTSTFTDLVIS
jgi:hypothetical protein